MFSKQVGIFVVIDLVVLLLTLAVATIQADTPPVGLLSFDPTSSPVPVTVGSSTSVDARLDNITGVYGAEIGMGFNPAILQVVGGGVTPGVCPAEGFIAQNTADNMAGTINYAITQLAPATPCNGGVAATIEFQCVAEGISPISFDSSIIADPDGLLIAHTIQNGTIECVDVPPVTIQGVVGLQGWPSPEGAEVVLKDGGGMVVDLTTVGPAGSFLFQAETGVTYSVEASNDRYLGAMAGGLSGNEGDTIDLGPTALPAGDLNGDGTINILDLVLLAGNFGKSTHVNW